MTDKLAVPSKYLETAPNATPNNYSAPPTQGLIARRDGQIGKGILRSFAGRDVYQGTL
jgi:hypothetical protein